MVKRKSERKSEEELRASSNSPSSSKAGERFVDVGKAGTEQYEASEEVRDEFDQAAQLGAIGQQQLIDELLESTSRTSPQSEAAFEAAWEDGDVGGESIEDGNPTPDQNVVDDLGRAVGLVYEDDEPLHTPDKISSRDEHRWELDPASSEGFNERMKHEGEYEEK